MPFQARIRVIVDALFSKAAADLTQAVSSMPLELLYDMTDGTGVNQARNIFSDTRTLASGAVEQLDLNQASTGLINVFGNSVLFTKLRLILIAAAASNTVNLSVGPAATNGFLGPWNAAADRTKVGPNGVLFLYAPDVNGWTVTAGTGDLIEVVNAAGASSTYSIVLIGSP